MKPRKKGNRFELNYRCPGYDKIISERFDTIEEAELRVAEIKLQKSRGEFRPPKSVLSKNQTQQPKIVTVRMLLEEYVQLYGLNHWGESYLSMNTHRIEHYINPYIGDIALCDLTARDLDIFYNSLLGLPAVVLKGHKDTETTIGLSVIKKIHDLLRNALNKAIDWGYIQTNPALCVEPPKHRAKKREVWTTEQARYALDNCEDPVLRLAFLLGISCSMRIGEILGLQWSDLHITDEDIQNETACLRVWKELKRCQKSSLEKLRKRDRDGVILTFPEYKKTGCSTSLVLKETKTESSERTIFLGRTTALALREAQTTQEKDKALLGDDYMDFDLVIAHNNGRPYESRQILKAMKKLSKDLGLPDVVFHSLRHTSTSMKLIASGGDIKAVQGDTGHSQSRMVTEVYSHTFSENRRQLAKKIDSEFFGSPKSDVNEETALNQEILELLKANPEAVKLLTALLKSG